MSPPLRKHAGANRRHLEAGGLPVLPALPLKNLKPIFLDFDDSMDPAAWARRIWWVSNGIGGYAAGAITGMNSCRSHGLLAAALDPPAGRVLMLSKFEETLVAAPRGRYELSVNRHPGTFHPEGHRYLVQFRLDPWPTFLYRIGGILLEKWVFMLPGENATVVGYALHAAPGPVRLNLRPLIPLRPLDRLTTERVADPPKCVERPGEVTIESPEVPVPLVLHHSAEWVESAPCWVRGVVYPEDRFSPGAREDLWSFGELVHLLRVGEAVAVVASTGRQGTAEPAFHQRRVENTLTVAARLQDPPGAGTLAARLSWSAEQFLVRKKPLDERLFLQGAAPTGPPAGREALIALPGLLLATGRQEPARAVLETLAREVKDGLVPVRFSEEGCFPEYDSADTSLWFIWAVWHYWKSTRDLKFIRKSLLLPMEEIIQGYLDGTLFGIGMEEDGLVVLPDETLPLTWMDAWEPGKTRSAPGCAVTPRNGCPVEINALWYCALKIMETLEEEMGRRRAATFHRLAHLVQGRFQQVFVSPTGAVYDRVLEGLQDPSHRPNALIAAGLPFTPFSKEQAARVLADAERELLTPFGLRTLSPKDGRYQGRCAGNLKAQAQAMHQGTVWSWLMGPYVSTVLKVRRLTRSVQSDLKGRIGFFLEQMERRHLGIVPALFDGDAPHAPRAGAGAEAAAAGMLLKGIQEAKLRERA
ncbi:MAG: hypothetical protein COV76_00555 [Candidatus Omnitrophica bacterium CG11_big_fil_rev_8_21_14_0_20_64_10]|nr:MAG: hypothetical protein COV76_00555 [Candidatus Omnitrophica bacterium CG11_big_fil_rev_8_21_14_0_20_64_10]